MNEIANLFPLSIYQAHLGLSAEERQRMADAIIAQKRERTIKKNERSSWTGDVNGFLDLHRDPRFANFFSQVAIHINRYLSLLGLNPAEYQVHATRSWGTVTEKNERINYHIHDNSAISVVYYLTYPENAGSLLFQDANRRNELTPGLFAVNPKHPRQYKPNAISAMQAKTTICEEDLLLLFPSKVSHGTEMSKSDETRVSIAIDTLITVADATGEEFLLPPVDTWKRL